MVDTHLISVSLRFSLRSTRLTSPYPRPTSRYRFNEVNLFQFFCLHVGYCNCAVVPIHCSGFFSPYSVLREGCATDCDLFWITSFIILMIDIINSMNILSYI